MLKKYDIFEIENETEQKCLQVSTIYYYYSLNFYILNDLIIRERLRLR